MRVYSWGEKIGTILLVPFIVFLTIALTQKGGKGAEYITMIGVAFFCYSIYRVKVVFFSNFDHEHRIHKDAVLRSSRIDEELARITKDENTGVLAAQTPNGSNFYITDQDRACVIGPVLSH